MATRKRPVFYSFHFGSDVMRVQMIRNIGALDGNEPVSAQKWESLKRSGDRAVEKWIDDNMKYKQCVIVLVGTETASRPWVQFEIKKAWEENYPLFGVYIHNVNCPRGGRAARGQNPFANFNVDGVNMARLVDCHDPGPRAYQTISQNIDAWIDQARYDRDRR